MRRLVLVVPALLLVGCALTPEERRVIIEEAAALAGDRAALLAHEQALAAGLSEEDARKLAEVARREAGEAAARIAERAIPKAEEEKRGKVGGAIASVLMMLLQLASGFGRKGGAA